MFTHQARGCLSFFCEELYSYVDTHVHTWALSFIRWRSSSYRCGCFHSWVLIFICAWSFPYVRSCFRTCVVVFEWMRVSGVVGMDVLWLSRTVVVVWSSWTHCGWGRCGHGCGVRGGRGHCGCGGSCHHPCPLLLLLVGYGWSLSVV